MMDGPVPVRGVAPYQVPGDDWGDWRWQLEHRAPLSVAIPEMHPAGARAGKGAPASLPPYLWRLLEQDEPQGPLRRQFLPDPREDQGHEWLAADPLAEEGCSPVPGLIRRYPDRVLVVLTSRCAAYCRYCFRRRHWGREEGLLSEADRDGIVRFIELSQEVREVVISGGDPLLAPDDVLTDFLGSLGRIPHVEVLRLATRTPVVLPMRITGSLADRLAACRPLWISIQANHPRELTPEMTAACDRLLRRGIPLLSQSVLLRGINDRPDVLSALFTGLERRMIKPYYLHQADPVRGTEHFRTSIADGMRLMESLRGRLAGPAIPAYVVDSPGQGGKVPVVPPYLRSNPDDEWVRFVDNRGEEFRYPNPRG